MVIRPSRRVNSYVDLVERFQLPIPLISEDDKKRRNPHLAFPSLNKCNVVRATAAAIARGKRNLEGVLPSQRSTEIPGRSSQTAVLTVSPSFHLGRCESPLGNYSNDSHEPLRATPLRLPAAPGDSRKRCEAWTFPHRATATGAWRTGFNGRSPANSLPNYFVTEAPPTARKASCFRQPISARIALARPQCGDLTCA